MHNLAHLGENTLECLAVVGILAVWVVAAGIVIAVRFCWRLGVNLMPDRIRKAIEDAYEPDESKAP